VQPSIISSRVTGGFAALLVMLVLVFIASVHGASRLADLDTAVARARDVLDEIGVTRSAFHEVESARRGYLLTRQSEFLELYLAAMKDAVAHLDRLRDLTGDDPAQRRRVDALGPLATHQLTLVTETIASSFNRPRDGAAPAPTPVPDDGTIVAEQIRGLMAELEDVEGARLRDREAEANARTVKVIRGFGAVALIALLLLGAAYYILDRDAAVHAAVLEELRMYSRSAAASDATSQADAATQRAARDERGRAT
jgi:CHASE3 domain sensor protein